MSASLVETALGRDRALLIGAMAVLFLLSGLYTVLGVGMDMSAIDMTRMAGMRDMPGMREAGSWGPGYFVLVFLMWWVMMVAMMLPSVAPTVLLYAALLRKTGSSVQVPVTTAMFLAGYLAVWAGFSIAAAVVQHSLETAGIVSATMMTLVETVPGAVVLIVAGAFQFTPWKDRCLSHCRSPAEFIARRRRAGVSGAFTMGLEHGLYCLGCCWFLMALLFVGGIMNLYWIVGLAAFVALEKLTPYGKLASKAAGVLLIAWGLWVILV